MTVKELKKLLDNADVKDYDKVEVITKLKKNAGEYSVEYVPIKGVEKVMVGVGVYVLGIRIHF
jgi:hypoxanthine-guanine phosphoribosyltransferase